jgi:hypothetical protein
MPKQPIDYAKRKHYDKATGQLVDAYPDGMTPQQWYRRNKPKQPKTLGEALTLIHNLRVHNKGLLTRIKNLENAYAQAKLPPE